MMPKQKKFFVKLFVPTFMWANIEVEANSVSQAEKKALQMAHNDEVEFEYGDFDVEETEIVETEELENDD
jgi:hypothetical protein